MLFGNTNIIMQDHLQKFRKSSIVFEKPGILPKRLKALRSFNYLMVQFILFTSWVICQNKNDLVSTHSQKSILWITQDLNKNKQNSEHPSVDIVNWEICAKFKQKILNFMVVKARQSFQFFRQITWFLRNNTA